MRPTGCRWAVLVGVVSLTAGGGCTPAVLWHVFGGDDKRPAEFPLAAKDGKKTVTVALLPTAAPDLPVDFAGVDRELADLLARRLADDTKADRRPIAVVPQAKVDDYLAKHPNWKVGPAGHVAAGVGADYLIDLSVNRIGLYDAERYGQEVFAGRANVSVAVYDAAAPDKPVKEYIHNAQAPAKPASTDAGPAAYRRWFVERLATELAWRHVPHGSERDLRPLQ